MALHSTVASIQNIRKQRLLELELVQLERKWHVELKAIARERLVLVKELCRMDQEMREMDHFKDTMHGKDITHFADKARGRLQQGREAKETHKFSFQVDPAEKLNMQLPLLPNSIGQSDGKGADRQAVTSKDLLSYRVQLQKTNFEQCTADRRSRRRPFWDKAIIESRNQKKKSSQAGNGFHRQQQRPVGLVAHSLLLNQHVTADMDEGPRKLRGLSKSPSLPALNRLRRTDAFKTNAVHPSLSKRNSASLGYLPVIGAREGREGLLKAHRPGSFASSVSSMALPAILEV